VSLTVHAPVVTVVVTALAVDAVVAVVAAAVGDAVALAGVTAPPHAANRKLAAARTTIMRDGYRKIMSTSAVCSSDLTRRNGAAR